MTLSDFGALTKAVIAAIPKAVADYKANKPRAPGSPLTGAQAAAVARKLQTWLALAIPVLDDHPGAITAADDILEVLDAHGVTGASDIEAAIGGAPDGLSTLDKVLPEIIWALGAFEPAATGIQGDHNDPMFKDQ